MTDKLDIMTVDEAIARFREAHPKAKVTKLQLEYTGPFLKYEFVGVDGGERHSYEFNASTGQVLKNRSKALKAKRAQKMQAKVLELENIMGIEEASKLAKEQVPVDRPFEWELDRKKGRTIWKVELTTDQGHPVYEVKLDAQDGTIVQTKLKS